MILVETHTVWLVLDPSWLFRHARTAIDQAREE
jgi:hypothetical protein